MKIIVSVLALAVSLSIDAFGTGMSYGMRKIKIPAISKLIICFFSMLYSALSLLAGGSLAVVLPEKASKFAGIVILIFIGIWIIMKSLRGERIKSDERQETSYKSGTLFKLVIRSLGITVQVIRNPYDSDIDRSGTIDVRESILLGLALSVDAIGAGVGSALSGFSPVYIPIAVGVFQWFFLFIGTLTGKKLSQAVRSRQKLLAVLPGFLIIILAVLRV